MIVFWTFPKADFALWCEHCQGSGSWQEYRERLVAVIADQERQGRKVETVEIPVMAMLAELEKRGWPNDTQHRALIAAEWK